MKYALLDTDFISKAYCIMDNDGNRLIDRILELPGYEFFCHSQIVLELEKHDDATLSWIKKRIHGGDITCCSDEDVLSLLSGVYGPLACSGYTQMLSSSCAVFSREFFSLYFHELEDIDYSSVSEQEYLEKISKLDSGVEHRNNMGEIKIFILLQVLSLLSDESVKVFCSDDRDARKGAVYLGNVQCLSLLSVFSCLKETGWAITDAEQYISSYISFCEKHSQTNFRVVEEGDAGRIIRMPIRKVFAGDFLELRNIVRKIKTGGLWYLSCALFFP